MPAGWEFSRAAGSEGGGGVSLGSLGDASSSGSQGGSASVEDATCIAPGMYV